MSHLERSEHRKIRASTAPSLERGTKPPKRQCETLPDERAQYVYTLVLGYQDSVVSPNLGRDVWNTSPLKPKHLNYESKNAWVYLSPAIVQQAA